MSMARSVLMLCLAFFALESHVELTKAADCVTFISGSTLKLPENTVCELVSDISVDVVEILGQAVGTVSNVTITCVTFTIEAGGIVSLAGQGHGPQQGPGAGTAGGSGGIVLHYVSN